MHRTLTERRAALDALAPMLLEHEVIDRSTLDQVLVSQPAAPQKDGRPVAPPAHEREVLAHEA